MVLTFNNSFRIIYILYELLVFGSVFLFSYQLFPYYTSGDQLHYNNFYEQVRDLNWIQSLGLNAALLSSYEPGYPTIIWLLGNYVDKIIFISICNSIFALVCFKLAVRIRCYPLLAYLIIVTNFYFYVCYFSAERLKFSLLFFSLSLLYINQKKTRAVLTLISILCHLQISIVIICMYLPKFNFKTVKSNKGFIFIFLVTFVILFIQIIPYLSYKLSIYLFRYLDWEGLIKIFIFFFFSLKYSSDKKLAYWAFLPILFFLLLLSGERVTILAYFVFMFFSVQYHRGLNFGLIVVNLYFLFKSIFFIDNVIKFGDGF